MTMDLFFYIFFLFVIAESCKMNKDNAVAKSKSICCGAKKLSINFNFRFIALARVMYVSVSIRCKILDSEYYTHTHTHMLPQMDPQCTICVT